MVLGRPGLHFWDMDDLKQHLAETFRAARLRMGLTQETLAEQVGVTTETISNSERAASLVTLPVFLKLALALDLSLAEMIDVPVSPARRIVTARRRRMEGDLEKLGEQMNDADLDLLLGIGRLVQAGRKS
jgi:transcriptional regulator with XRE-family HTH domain